MIIQYDPDDFLLSSLRSLGSYISETLNDPDVRVEQSFPDTSTWTKETPLAQSIIHLDKDDVSPQVLGFGIPGKDVFTDEDNDTVEDHVERQEAFLVEITYDVGIWVSTEMGGVTTRAELHQALISMFGSPGGRIALNEATGGINVVSFHGGRDQLDRVNDLPVWRVLDLNLIIRVIGRNRSEPVQLIQVVSSDGSLVIPTSIGLEEV